MDAARELDALDAFAPTPERCSMRVHMTNWKSVLCSWAEAVESLTDLPACAQAMRYAAMYIDDLEHENKRLKELLAEKGNHEGAA